MMCCAPFTCSYGEHARTFNTARAGQSRTSCAKLCFEVRYSATVVITTTLIPTHCGADCKSQHAARLKIPLAFVLPNARCATSEQLHPICGCSRKSNPIRTLIFRSSSSPKVATCVTEKGEPFIAQKSISNSASVPDPAQRSCTMAFEGRRMGSEPKPAQGTPQAFRLVGSTIRDASCALRFRLLNSFNTLTRRNTQHVGRRRSRQFRIIWLRISPHRAGNTFAAMSTVEVGQTYSKPSHAAA